MKSPLELLLGRKRPSAAADRFEKLEVRQGHLVASLYHRDILVLEELAERKTVVQRDGRRTAGRRFLAGARENLTGRDEPAAYRRPVVVERAAKVANAFTTDLSAILANDDGGADLVPARPVNGRKVGFATRCTCTPHEAKLRHSNAFERDQRKLDERMTWQLLNAPQKCAPRAFAIAVNSDEDVLLESNEIGPKEPLRWSHTSARSKPEARALPKRAAAQVVRTKRRSELRRREGRITAEPPATHEMLDDGTNGHWPSVAIECGEDDERSVCEVATSELVSLR